MELNTNHNIKIFIYINILSFLLTAIDILFSDGNKCLKNIDKIKTKIFYILLIYIHQLFVNNIYFCFFYKNIHINYFIIFSLFFTILHWQFLDQKCIMTIAANNLCKSDEIIFNDITKIIGLKKGKGHIMYIIFGIIIVYNFYEIYNNKKN